MNIVVAAGGTGGDLFPAIAVVEQLARLVSEEFIADFTGSPTRIESRIVPSLGYGFTPIPAAGFKGWSSLSAYSLPWRIFRSEQIVRSLIKKKRPVGMICGGNYISFPAARAAFGLNIPVMLVEPNAMPGKTNRLLAPKARRIIAAFEETKEYFKPAIRNKIIVAGNPTRESLTLSLPDRKIARLSFGLRPDAFTVFVFGGSLGAKSLNLAVEAALPQIAQQDFQVIWQTGENYLPASDLPPNVAVRKFIDDMAAPYSAADVALCRSGGGTVAELGNVGKPAILVPLPSSANNEQYYNARSVADCGAAILVENSDIGEQIFPLLCSLRGNPDKLAAMSAASARRARPDAARRAAEEFLSMLQTNI